jgi:predicted enzyme related to lactoylglutathione lyase
MKAQQLCWFEIPVSDIDRAIAFYREILGVKIEKKMLLDKHYGIFDKGVLGIGGVLVQKENYSPGKGTILFFSVIDLSDVLKTSLEYKGRIILPKTLIKQMNSDGNTVITQNLIDDNIGYYAEITDSEGNHIGLYSNS